MLTVTNSYSSQAYALVQNTPPARVTGESGSKQRPSSSADQQDDAVTLSPEGKDLSRNASSASVSEEAEKLSSMEKKGADQQPLSEEELKQLTQLKRRDTEVRNHEQAHLAAAGQYAAGGASFSYQTGADGKRYAVGGEVPIDIGKESSPEATIQKMRTVKRAALAPANPSPADRSIAASATTRERQAMQEIMANSSQNAGNKPVTAIKEDVSPSADDSTGVQEENQAPAPVSELSRRIMNVAYQGMADLVA